MVDRQDVVEENSRSCSDSQGTNQVCESHGSNSVDGFHLRFTEQNQKTGYGIQ
jgi:hypothetical protein